jgi:hypothetical protein
LEYAFRGFLYAAGTGGNAFAVVGNPHGCFGSDIQANGDALSRILYPNARHLAALVQVDSLSILLGDIVLTLVIPFDLFQYLRRRFGLLAAAWLAYR